MAKIYFADGVDCRIALQEGASVGDALATAAARLDVKKPHARFLALHAASATGAVEAAPLGRATALANGGRLVILVRLWTPGLRAAVEEDAALRDLAFRQARCCAQGDTWPCPVRDSARAAAAQLQLVDGSAPPLSLAEVRAALPRCLSRRVLLEINQCVGCTRKFFTKSFPGDDTAVLAPSDGEESTLPRHRAGVASNAP